MNRLAAKANAGERAHFHREIRVVAHELRVRDQAPVQLGLAWLVGADPGHKRFMVCGCCATRWRYRRTACPFLPASGTVRKPST